MNQATTTSAQAAEVARLSVRHAHGRSRAGAVASRALDIGLASILLLLLAPVLLVIACAIRVDSGGPIIFRQRRVGRGRQRITVLKFRTMIAGADASRHREYVGKLIHGEPSSSAPSEPGLFKLVVDDRMTRVGRILRRWSLDELPQLWNVLSGRMSLVGPRPVIEYEVDLYPDWYMDRFAVKPGLTGLWQVSGRNQRTYEEMVRYDIEYARGQSLLGDLSILLKTVLVVATRRGAA